MQLNGIYIEDYQILGPENKAEACSIRREYTSGKLHSINAKAWPNIFQKETSQKVKNIEVRRVSSRQSYQHSVYSN